MLKSAWFCAHSTFSNFFAKNLETEGQEISRLRKAFLVDTIVISSTGPKKVATLNRWPLAEIAVRLAQSVEYLTAGEVAGWIPGTGLNLSVLKQTEK